MHPTLGNDNALGSKKDPYKSLAFASKINLKPGDRIILASSQIYIGSLQIINKSGSRTKPIHITSHSWDTEKESLPATINFKGYDNGIYIENSSFINISNINLIGNGHFKKNDSLLQMRCGVLVKNRSPKGISHINLNSITIQDVFYENKGFKRDKKEVKTANGTQKYGWGIRVINEYENSKIDSLKITNCNVKNVSHTGIKLTGINKNIQHVLVENNNVTKTGGPGIQMSGVKEVHVLHNVVNFSGSHDDSRKWGRGSGLWTWGSSRVLIEKNKFLNANGPADSAGAHIDFNCDNVV